MSSGCWMGLRRSRADVRARFVATRPARAFFAAMKRMVRILSVATRTGPAYSATFGPMPSDDAGILIASPAARRPARAE